MDENKEILSTEKRKDQQLKEQSVGTVTIVKKKPNIYLIVAIISLVLVAAIVILTMLYLNA